MKTKFAYPEPRDLKFERTENIALKTREFAAEQVRKADMIANAVVSVAAVLLLLALVGVFRA